LWLSDAPKYLVFGVDISPCFGNAAPYIALFGLEEKGIVVAFCAQADFTICQQS
jgi:hypothetical protein